MTPAGQALEADHRVIDEQFATFATAAEEGVVDRDSLTVAADGLRLHIWVEEELFFPPLSTAGIMGPIMVMHREHGEIWRSLDELEGIIAADEPDLPAALEVWRSLENILMQHNLKEEQILYAAADRMLDAQTAAEVTAGLDQELPEGWTCTMAGTVR